MATPNPREHLARLIAGIARRWRAEVDARMRPLGLTEATWLPLLRIARMGQVARQKDLALELGVEDASVVRLIDQLEGAGLVERIRDPGDRRARMLKPTEEGLELCQQLNAIAVEVRASVLSTVSDEEVALCIGILTRIDAALRREDAPEKGPEKYQEKAG